jgi:hypothetical protein
MAAKGKAPKGGKRGSATKPHRVHTTRAHKAAAGTVGFAWSGQGFKEVTR